MERKMSEYEYGYQYGYDRMLWQEVVPTTEDEKRGYEDGNHDRYHGLEWNPRVSPLFIENHYRFGMYCVRREGPKRLQAIRDREQTDDVGILVEWLYDDLTWNGNTGEYMSVLMYMDHDEEGNFNAYEKECIDNAMDNFVNGLIDGVHLLLA